MIKTPAIKATRKLKAAEKQLVAKILHEIIALRHPEGYDEHDVDDENENVSIAIRHKIIQRYIFIYLCSHMKIYDMFFIFTQDYVRYMDLQTESDENISSTNIVVNKRISSAHMVSHLCE